MCENLLDNMYIEKRKEEYRIKLLKIRETDIDIYLYLFLLFSKV